VQEKRVVTQTKKKVKKVKKVPDFSILGVYTVSVL
jgi:hypothetical protein